MQFNLHPSRYRVRVCPGPLQRDGEPVAALVHGRELLLCGTLAPHDRAEALVDQLLRLREKHHGPLSPDGLPALFIDLMRQLLSQGGEPALQRLQPDGMVDAGAAADLSAEPVGCECGQCGTKFAAHQIATAAAEFDAGSGRLAVKRSVFCEFCDTSMHWTEGATPAGRPNGRVMAGPVYGATASVSSGA